ncbi:MAG: TolC family protein [Spirochaetales bacterium]|nr:TolC family protein [Spirochaetales bacterium]
MKTVRNWSLLVALVLSSGVAFADKISLTPQTAVEYALENNISLKQEKITLDSKEREKKYSWNGVSPSASLSASYTSSIPSKEKSRDTISAGARISATLTPSLYAQVKSAALAYDSQEINYESARTSISFSVIKNYYEILYEKENLSLSEKNLETKKNQYKSNLEKFNRGMLNQVDVLSAQINYQNTELTFETQKINLESNIAIFKQTLGIPQDQEVEFSGDFNGLFNFKKITGESIQINSPSVALLEKQLESARNSLLLNRFKAYGPSLTASYNYSTSYFADGFEKNSNGGSLSVGASIPLDGIMPWSSSAQSINSSKDNIESIELKLENEKESIRIKTESLVKKINQCVDNLKVRKDSIKLAETNYDMTLKAYNYGTRDLLTLQSAQDSLLSSKVNLIAEANTMVASICELENICGMNPGTLLGENK